MSIYSRTIQGSAASSLLIDKQLIEKSQNQQLSYHGITECSCTPLDRFSVEGGAIREAYENSVVNAMEKLYPSQESLLNNENIRIVVIGSGGLLQEVIWLQKMYQKIKPAKISLYLVDTGYSENDIRVVIFSNFLERNVVPLGCTLNVVALRTCKFFNTTFRPDLVIGINTNNSTFKVVEFQSALNNGYITKALIVGWTKTVRGLKFKFYSKQERGKKFIWKYFDNHLTAAQTIKNAGLLDVGNFQPLNYKTQENPLPIPLRRRGKRLHWESTLGISEMLKTRVVQ